jgi:hypothetical protein
MDGLLLLIVVIALVVAVSLWSIKPLETGHHRLLIYRGKHRAKDYYVK